MREEVASPRKDLPGRLLRLLSLLQSRREWSGAELAERLKVSGRTVRRDIDRLRALDYPVESVTGTAGGYRLASGHGLPPLLLDDEEVIAVALGLVTMAGGSVAGTAESSMRALAKLERILPARLRPRLIALGDAAVAVPAHEGTPRVDPVVLAVLASCCRDRQMLGFEYLDRAGAVSTRRVEPHHLVTAENQWYLIAYDPGREDWRNFRIDRIAGPRPLHGRFLPRPLPAQAVDPAAYLTRSFATAAYRHTVRLRVALAPGALRSRLFARLPGTVEPDGPEACVVHLTAESAELITQYVAAIAALDTAYTLLEATAEVKARIRALRRRLHD
ncbi:YafY family protein [Nonomuraea wenchangensis]